MFYFLDTLRNKNPVKCTFYVVGFFRVVCPPNRTKKGVKILDSRPAIAADDAQWFPPDVGEEFALMSADAENPL